ncbi:MAG: phosphopantothenoylcysteine decarboxylase [Verrucomicrobiota bacterium]|jgi:phosphopantothenoylcysteine decarboxylase/phosphopantothenate--cysteine ligase
MNRLADERLKMSAGYPILPAMNCIVTAGPTYEPLDEVRRLTNFSTGRLGTELANFLAARGHKVTLLVGEQATYSGERRAHHVEIFTTTADLRARLKTLASRRVEAIFHAAAVSDFVFGKFWLRSPAGELAEFKSPKKIPTREGKLLVELAPTPKILPELRGWFPQTRIVGWKFEADGGRADAINAAKQQITECNIDACVVNGPAYGEGFGVLLSNNKVAHLPHAPTLFVTLEKIARRDSPS